MLCPLERPRSSDHLLAVSVLIIQIVVSKFRFSERLLIVCLEPEMYKMNLV